MNHDHVAFVDIETLGLDPYRHAVWEVAIIVDDDEILFQIHLSDEEIATGDPVGMDICQFHHRYEATAAYPSWTAAAIIEEALSGRHIVGAVPSFDEQRLALLCDRAFRGGHPPERRPWHYHLIDVEAMAVGALAARGEIVDLPWRSHDLSTRLGVTTPVEDEHTALGDARWARAIYETIMRDQ
jgi:DNA polymerase III epsilon subunit-like protein